MLRAAYQLAKPQEEKLTGSTQRCSGLKNGVKHPAAMECRRWEQRHVRAAAEKGTLPSHLRTYGLAPIPAINEEDNRPCVSAIPTNQERWVQAQQMGLRVCSAAHRRMRSLLDGRLQGVEISQLE